MDIRTTILSCLLLLGARGVAQPIGLKTNLLMDATLNVNLGLELPLTPHWTADITGEYNNWTLSHGRRWRHWYAQPEARYWLCNRLTGHFVGIHGFFGKYNIGGLDNDIMLLGTDFSNLSHTRYQGWALGAGVAYGYTWLLDRHWNLEAEIGVGYAYSRYDRFRCVGCGKKLETDRSHHYVGPTKAAINLVYIF